MLQDINPPKVATVLATVAAGKSLTVAGSLFAAGATITLPTQEALALEELGLISIAWPKEAVVQVTVAPGRSMVQAGVTLGPGQTLWMAIPEADVAVQGGFILPYAPGSIIVAGASSASVP